MTGDYRDVSVEARRDIRDHHGRKLAACSRVEEFAVGMMANWTGRPIGSTADGLVAAILARSIDTFSCAARCSRLGYGAQAAMLNRSLFEDMVDAHWIAADGPAAETLYADHHQLGRMLLADVVPRFPNIWPDVVVPEFDPAERKRLIGLFGDHGTRPWSRINIHERVALIEDQWATEHDRAALQFMLKVAHRENNQMLHVSAQSLNAVVAVDDTGRPAFRLGPRSDMITVALFGSFWTFAQTVTAVVDRFQFPMTQDERDAMFSAEDFRGPNPAGPS